MQPTLNFPSVFLRSCLLGLAVLISIAATKADAAQLAGEIVSARGDEVVRKAGTTLWKLVSVGQDVNVGDELRTGRFGSLSIVLADETQIRLHRRSRLTIDSAGASDGTKRSGLSLAAGSLWSRARSISRTISGKLAPKRGLLSVRTPAATLGIRGTDWHVRVDSSGITELTVLSGHVQLANDHGRVDVSSGQGGQAAKDGAPTSSTIVNLRDRPLIVLELDQDWHELVRLSEGPWRPSGAAQETVTDVASARHAIDTGQFAAVRAWLARADTNRSLHTIEEVLRAVHDRDFAGALALLEAKESRLSGRDVLLGGLIKVGIAAEHHDFARAEDLIRNLGEAFPDSPDVASFAIWLKALEGSHANAVEMARKAKSAFPTDARFPVHLALLHFL
ncbi:MAG: FecR domain-containing protein, partial [Chromatiales bacterium]|nr:FecR domain-containing protein [Chromatiales bacterium]